MKTHKVRSARPEVAAQHEPSYLFNMSTVQEIEDAVKQLTADERAAFRAWFAEFDAGEWDRQLETDVAAGKLDWLISEARADREAGRCTDR
jgi:hypothetical protein